MWFGISTKESEDEQIGGTKGMIISGEKYQTFCFIKPGKSAFLISLLIVIYTCMNPDIIFSNISRHIKLSKQGQGLIEEMLEQKSYKKGTTLLSEGQSCSLTSTRF
jgi:hypothetical protein